MIDVGGTIVSYTCKHRKSGLASQSEPMSSLPPQFLLSFLLGLPSPTNCDRKHKPGQTLVFPSFPHYEFAQGAYDNSKQTRTDFLGPHLSSMVSSTPYDITHSYPQMGLCKPLSLARPRFRLIYLCQRFSTFLMLLLHNCNFAVMHYDEYLIHKIYHS